MTRPGPACTMLLFVLVGVGAVRGQTPTGTIAGRFTDPSGAAIAGARIVIAHQQTRTQRTLVTDSAGDYSTPGVMAGAYEITADTAGFEPIKREVIVEAGSTTTVDLVARIGTARTQLTVPAAPQLRYDTHSVAGVITQSQIATLPLNGRNFLELAKLEPGAQVPVRASNNRMLVPLLGAPQGQNGRATRITVDGGSIMQVGNGGSAMGFSQEVVQEFQVSSVNPDLSTGVTGSGAVNIVTRGGGNELHGSAFFFFRDHHLAAGPALQRDPVNPDPFFQRRQFGAALGGPIRKDRFFWFGAFERNEQRGVITTEPVTPEFVPLTRTTATLLYANQFSARADFRASDRHLLFVRHSHEDVSGHGPSGLTGSRERAYPSAWTRQPAWADQSVAGLTSQFTPQLVNEVRFSYFFVSSAEDPMRSADCQGCLGMGAPAITVSPDLFIGLSTTTALMGRRFHLNDVVSWQKGSHRLHYGGDWEVTRGGRIDLANEPVSMTLFSPKAVRDYNATVTADKQIPLPRSFLTLSDILQLPLQSFVVGIGDPYVPQKDFGRTRVAQGIHLFAHDVWRMHRRLSVNYGLGWTFDAPLNYDLRKPAYLLPLLGQAGLRPTRRNWTDFSPSAGFAWSPQESGKTVVRAGIGTYYDFRVAFGVADPERVSLGPMGVGRDNYAGSGIANPLPNAGVPLGTLLNFTNPTGFTGANLLQALPTIRATLLQARGNPVNRDFSVTNIEANKQGMLVAADLPSVASVHVNIGVQREIASDFVVSADFVMRRFRNLGAVPAFDINQFLAAGGPVLPVCSPTQRTDPKALCSLGPVALFAAVGSARYHGLLVRADKRLSRRWQFLGSYAWSSNVGHSFGNGFNLKDWLANYGPLDRDVRHVVNLSGVYLLPKDFRLSWVAIYYSKPPAAPFLGGLDLNGDGTTGDLLPGTTVNQFGRGLGKSDLRRLVADFNSRYAGGNDARGRPIPVIALPATFEFSDPFWTHDARLSRDFALHERWRVTLLAEVFNVFNIANLSGRSTDLISAGFGQPTRRVDQVFGSGGARSFQLAARVSW